jgi:hypothetical protein
MIPSFLYYELKKKSDWSNEISPPRQQPKIRVGNADFSPDTHKWDIIVQSNWPGMKWSSVASAHAWS